MLLIGGKRLVFTGLIAALLAAVAFGCGGSSDAAPLKKSQFIKQADEVCASAQAERTDQSKELAESEDSGEELMQSLLEPVKTMTDELSNLGPPVGQEKEVEAIIAAYEAGIEKLEADPDPSSAVTAFDKANGLAESYGLTGCSI